MKSKLLVSAIIIASLYYGIINSVHAKELTRAEVMAELAELRALGYRSTAEDPHYPRHIQEMMAKLNEKRMKERAEAGKQGMPEQSQIKNRAPTAPAADETSEQNKCVGPASFCNTYFGS
ncbi:DUF4148 domain-containing protein [Burkholderia cepacia]|uniref:DUF4148 domain-containing protein n=1 Tax=Burkholderia cepacia TaxID=292 RepID=UPI0009C08E1E|nr:DUF4148 domain-containing protein [Burkholderia cepacia]